MLTVYDYRDSAGKAGFEARLKRLKQTVRTHGDAAAVVAELMADVEARGDTAVVEATQRFSEASFSADDLLATPQAMDKAVEALPATLRNAIEAAIDNVRTYQQHAMPAVSKNGSDDRVEVAGAQLGVRWSAVDSAGLCVPGGSAPLFSTLIMLAVPALVAGVPADRIAVMHPLPTRSASGNAQGRDTSKGAYGSPVLAVARLLGLSRVYRMGGASGVAALAYGTERVEAVDLIAGPGNVYVQLAKAQVAGVCGTDGGFYGPSEITTLCDDTAEPARVASDLLAQAEHDPGKCFLVTWQDGVAERVCEEVAKQLARLGRAEAIIAALENESCVVRASDRAQAIGLVNRLACEHVNLAVADAEEVLTSIRHAGEVFLGDAAPVAAGDYYAGPSHCLPTGTTARFTSGVSVYTFLKRTGIVRYPSGMPRQAAEHVAVMAEAEGLTAHAASARQRIDSSG